MDQNRGNRQDGRGTGRGGGRGGGRGRGYAREENRGGSVGGHDQGQFPRHGGGPLGYASNQSHGHQGQGVQLGGGVAPFPNTGTGIAPAQPREIKISGELQDFRHWTGMGGFTHLPPDTIFEGTFKVPEIPSGNKRRQDFDDDDNGPAPPGPRQPKAKKPKVRQEPEIIDPSLCGNCGGSNHKAAFCVTIDTYGWMEACPKCDSKRHLYDNCPQRVTKSEEDFRFLIVNRQNKPPVKTQIKLGTVIRAELQRVATPYRESTIMRLPYSSRFARQEARQNPPENYSYERVGDPAQEAELRATEPDRDQMDLRFARDAPIVGGQRWNENERTVDVTQDGPMPTKPTLQDTRGYLTSGVFPALLNILRTPAANPAANPRALSRSVAPVSQSQYVSASVAAMNRRRPPPVTWCTNCGDESHLHDACQNPCAACGLPEHGINDCDLKGLRCTCEQWPRHTREYCTQMCFICEIAHLAADCDIRCHRCLGQGHNMKECEVEHEKTKCPKCGGYHLAPQCVEYWCPVNECPNSLGCEKHCSGCGWSRDETAALEVFGHVHKCQFKKQWSKSDKPTVLLQCKANGAHIFDHGELTQLRKAASAQLMKALIRQTSFDSPPIEPIECPECLKIIKEE